MTQEIQPENEGGRKPPSIRQLGKYRVLEELGRGGMAIVFRAEDPETGAEVAIKALLPELAAQPSFIKRFRREIETHRALEHASIVPITDMGSEGDYQYYVMEYMDGPSVEKQLRLRGKFTVHEALKVVRSVLSALQYAHGKGIIHRDIKPANIMTNSKGEVKLADFGIARDIDATRLTVTGGIVGTADYMSPEQAEGRRVTRKSDIYSVGVCLYHMLTGRLPFVGNTYMDVIRAHRFSVAESPRLLNPSIPSRVAGLVESMMEKDPDKRPWSAAEALRQLEMVERSEGQLTEEERESARALVQWALFPAAGWKEITLKISVGIVMLVLVVCIANGLRYRYFTTPAQKFSLGMQALSTGDYVSAKKYFDEVVYFHPDSQEASLAEERIAEIRYLQRNIATSSQNRSKEAPDAVFLYERAVATLERGERERGIEFLKRIAADFAETEGGAMAAEKLAEIEGSQRSPSGPDEAPAPEGVDAKERQPEADL